MNNLWIIDQVGFIVGILFWVGIGYFIYKKVKSRSNKI